MAQIELFAEVIKLNSDRSYDRFSFLDDFSDSELDTSPGLILAGCDVTGPFAIGCRDTLTRFPEARYSGEGNDRCNHDAFAVDGNSQALYFIHIGDRELKRLPVDSTIALGPVERAATLTQDETEGANGMVVADNGDVYILVDTDNTKSILRITPDGTKTTEVDFMTRGAGTAAGVQRDLAIWRDGLRRPLHHRHRKQHTAVVEHPRADTHRVSRRSGLSRSALQRRLGRTDRAVGSPLDEVHRTIALDNFADPVNRHPGEFTGHGASFFC